MGHYPANGGQLEQAAHERLQSYSILGTARDSVFDRLVFTAAQALRVPIAHIALIDEDRLWFKASVGLSMPELPRSLGFCEEMVDDVPMVIEDATRDKRFANNPLVTGAPFIRFYAGAPLITPDGLRLGSLCVADRAPKTLTTRNINLLSQLAQSVVALLETRRPSAGVN